MGPHALPHGTHYSIAPQRSPDGHMRLWAPKALGKLQAWSIGGVVSEHLDSRRERGTFPFLSFPIQRDAKIFSSPWPRSIASLFKEDP